MLCVLLYSLCRPHGPIREQARSRLFRGVTQLAKTPHNPVGASLLAKAAVQPPNLLQQKRLHREQAHSYLFRGVTQLAKTPHNPCRSALARDGCSSATQSPPAETPSSHASSFPLIPRIFQRRGCSALLCPAQQSAELPAPGLTLNPKITPIIGARIRHGYHRRSIRNGAGQGQAV